MEFRKLLTKYRDSKGLKISELASKLEVSDGYIRNIETGHAKKPPTLSRCEKIAEILELNEAEAYELLEAAVIERSDPEVVQFLKKTKGLKSHVAESLSEYVYEGEERRKKGRRRKERRVDDIKKKIKDNVTAAFDDTTDGNKCIRRILGFVEAEIMSYRKLKH